MGLLAETFRKQPGVTRSIHATHSLAAIGPLANEICRGHQHCDTPCGDGSPYARLVERGASVLMFGVSFRYYTLFHTAEWLSGSESAAEPGEMNRLRVINESGEIEESCSKRQGRALPRFHEAGCLLEHAGFVRRAALGRSHLLFVADSAAVHGFLLERLRRSPDFLRMACKTPLE
jgi:aminoglycoside 3-N-acetyltransferase